jgi:hypothetical protein
MVVVTCAHVLRRGQWGAEIKTTASPATSETQVYETALADRRTPIRPLGAVCALDGWDFAWAAFAVGNGAEAIGELGFYRGPLDRRPAKGEAYGFMAWNRDTVFPLNVIERLPAFEVGMEFVGSTAGGMYRFRVKAKHKGHAFYRGASGAPIADSEGAIVALLANGDEAVSDIVQGTPFADAMAVVLGHIGG